LLQTANIARHHPRRLRRHNQIHLPLPLLSQDLTDFQLIVYITGFRTRFPKTYQVYTGKFYFYKPLAVTKICGYIESS
jgi:hypothetical protein